MPKTHRSVVFLGIAVIALAAFFPGGSLLDYAVLEVEWVLVPHPPSIPVPSSTITGHEQLASLLSLLPARAPPSLSLA